MKISVILTAAALAFGTTAFAETAEMQQDTNNRVHSARHADHSTSAGKKMRHAAHRAGDKTRHAMHRMRDSMHHHNTARRDHDRDLGERRAMGASRAEERARDDRARDDVDQDRRARMDDAYASWRSRQPQ